MKTGACLDPAGQRVLGAPAPDAAALVAALRDSLGRRIGEAAVADPDADLFELGLDSIDAVEVTGDIEACFGIEVDPEILFECRSVNRTAERLVASFQGPATA